MSNLRQLTSSFDNSSTFSPWRAVFEPLKSDMIMPATVFTFSDVPNGQGYSLGV
ncbi:hypothetical protein DM01DRAFT_1334726, partial [Hesseltinella vesiculosa]